VEGFSPVFTINFSVKSSKKSKKEANPSNAKKGKRNLEREISSKTKINEDSTKNENAMTKDWPILYVIKGTTAATIALLAKEYSKTSVSVVMGPSPTKEKVKTSWKRRPAAAELHGQDLILDQPLSIAR